MKLGVAEMQPTASTPSKCSASPYCLCSGADEHQRYMKRPAWSVSQRMTRGQHSRDKLRCKGAKYNKARNGQQEIRAMLRVVAGKSDTLGERAK